MSEYQPAQYTIIGHHLSQHHDLSLTAIGLGTHILSLPDGSPVDIKTLAEKFPEGRAKIAAALRELEAHGYIERVRERTPQGQFISRTFAYNFPEATRARRAREAQAGRLAPLRAVPSSQKSPKPKTSDSPSSTAAAPAPDADADPDPAPASAASPALGPAAAPTAAPAPAPSPAPAHRPAERRVPPPPLPRPTTPVPERMRTAAALLAALRHDDARLLLPERDVRRLAPAVAAWLERGAAPEAVRRALAAGLPPDLRHPTALLAHRLTVLLPPHLPADQPPEPTPRPPVVPLQNCDGCDRAFRAPHAGLCRDCRQANEAPALAA
ncbi:helix-turn-helix domain-containing protein [Streptomyces sparsogenes]|uniref:helix-turn-helix domain-containing protein n=1 Tax=Streptomyces sparsogenes TaxID=67365 RepID=UPI0008258C40|nr:helix-turn-helix domain-containing protein [Streptomyces sparsogenes]